MDAGTLIKRTRIVGSQSRNGCYTCKSRRIKCDETKPFCLRCQRSKQACEGYRDQVEPKQEVADDDSKLAALRENAPTFALACRPNGSQSGARFAALACTALQCAEVFKFGRCNTTWAISIPQLSCSVPVVAFAMASLGAALEADMLSPPTTCSAKMVAVKQYGKAIIEIQREVGRAVQPCEPLLLACMILACADIIQWRETNAFTHAQGSIALLLSRLGTKSRSSSPEDSKSLDHSSVDETATAFTPKDELDLLFIQIDLQIASYALGLPPRLPSIDLAYLLSIPEGERRYSNLELEVIQTVHSAYRVAQLLSEYKYRRRDSVPSTLIFEQAKQISRLAVCLGELRKHLASNVPLDDQSREGRSSAKLRLILRSQCLASLIYLSMISNSHECSYDSHAANFQQIVTDAELLFDSRSRDNGGAFCGFSIGLGILQPLFLTAIKYRDPLYRRRAIALLRRGGREGPFHGRLLAVVASRAVDIEESCWESGSQGVDMNTIVPERDRIHGVGMYIETKVESPGDQVAVTFSLCKDLDAMLEGVGDGEDPAFWEMRAESVYLGR